MSAKKDCTCKKTVKKTTLLVLDDLGGELKIIEPRLINLLVSNSGHYRLSIISLLELECLYKEVSVVERKLSIHNIYIGH